MNNLDRKERLGLSKQAIVTEPEILIEEIHSPESLRCLFAWALHSDDQQDMVTVYENAAIKATGKVAFRSASEAWRRIIIECRWISEGIDELDMMD